MLGRALDAGTPAAWVTGDEVYGADPGLRADLEGRRIGYVLAVAASHLVTTAAGPCQARTIAARLPRRAWQRCSAGQGTKGYRYYDQAGKGLTGLDEHQVRRWDSWHRWTTLAMLSAANCACSRRARSAAVSPPPSGYLVTPE